MVGSSSPPMPPPYSVHPTGRLQPPLRRALLPSPPPSHTRAASPSSPSSALLSWLGASLAGVCMANLGWIIERRARSEGERYRHPDGGRCRGATAAATRGSPRKLRMQHVWLPGFGGVRPLPPDACPLVAVRRRMRRALQRNAYVTLLKINGMLMVRGRPCRGMHGAVAGCRDACGRHARAGMQQSAGMQGNSGRCAAHAWSGAAPTRVAFRTAAALRWSHHNRRSPLTAAHSPAHTRQVVLSAIGVVVSIEKRGGDIHVGARAAVLQLVGACRSCN